MSQPASLDAPRDGEVVLTCQHAARWPWKFKAFYIGNRDARTDEGKLSGIGARVKSSRGHDLYVRWVVLCAWCRVVRRIRRQDPLARARREMRWVEEGGEQ